jgi:uncharacterized repeat protein (TIGR03803 family)
VHIGNAGWQMGYIWRVFVAGAFAVIATTGAQAYTERDHVFCAKGKCGFGPDQQLVTDGTGNYFGLTTSGGKYHNGTAYELFPSGDQLETKTIFDFTVPLGLESGGLVRDTSGNLYGVTDRLVYELVPNADKTRWHEKTLYTFSDEENGAHPQRTLTYFGAASGAPYDGIEPLYGVTALGGNNEHGVVFSLTRRGGTWSETAIYKFCAQASCADGASPTSILMTAPSRLIGTTLEGGGGPCASGCGTVFELHGPIASNKSLWQYRNLYSFCAGGSGCPDGTSPAGNIVVDSTGSIFGTTPFGGSMNKGTIYKVVPGGSGATESVIYNFCTQANCADGGVPLGGLTLGAGGTLFGTTLQGGNIHDEGEVFSFAGGQLNVLYAFCPGDTSCADGKEPSVPVTLDGDGNIFGVADGGRNATGVAFELSP